MDKITIDKHTYSCALSEIAFTVGTLKGINGALETLGEKINPDKLNLLIGDTHQRSEKALESLLQLLLTAEVENK